MMRRTGPLVRDGGRRRRAYPVDRVKPGTPIANRIRHYVAIDEATGCWVWQGSLVVGAGYGQLTVNRQRLLAHRASYEAFVGPIPDGLHIDHLCRNRACVNPQHLDPVTPLVNAHRSPITNATKAACPRGHVYDDANSYRACGRRYCRTCQSAWRRLVAQLTPEQRVERKAAGLPLVDLDAYFAEQVEAGAA